MRGSTGWPTITIHPSQHPAQLASQLVLALRSRRLPAKFHYLTPQQARRWLEVHAAYAPSGGSVAATTAAYRRLFEELAPRFASRPVQIVSLGCGGGQKDALLAEALYDAGCALRYLAVDAGQALVLTAADLVSGAAPGCRVRRLVADLDELDEWRAYVEQDGERGELQVFCAFGVTPSTDAERLIERLARQCAVGDQLLINANLYDPDDPEHCLRAILPQYDNLETRRWLATFFTDLDWAVEPEQFVFKLREKETPARISAKLKLKRTQKVLIDSSRLEVPGGTYLDVFFSNRFRPAELTALLERHGFGRSHCAETAASTEALWQAEKA